MLVLVPTREDVLAIRSIEEAFDLSTTTVRKREVALIRAAYDGNLLVLSEHAMVEADDEMIGYDSARKVAGTGKASSKDISEYGTRRIGLNMEGAIPIAGGSERRSHGKNDISW
jgi:hypothetical protein